MTNESIKAALVAFGLKSGCSITDVRTAYLEKTTDRKFQRVIYQDEELEKKFVKYYRDYVTLLKHFSETDSSSDLNYYPPDQLLKFHFNQGLYHLIKGNYIQAMEKFQFAHKIDTKNVLVLLYMGILLMMRKNYYAAEKYFQDAVKIDNRCEDAWYYLAENYHNAGEYRKALNMFETVRDLNRSRKGLALKILEVKDKMAPDKSSQPEETSFLGRLFGFFSKK